MEQITIQLERMPVEFGSNSDSEFSEGTAEQSATIGNMPLLQRTSSVGLTTAHPFSAATAGTTTRRPTSTTSEQTHLPTIHDR